MGGVAYEEEDGVSLFTGNGGRLLTSGENSVFLGEYSQDVDAEKPESFAAYFDAEKSASLEENFDAEKSDSLDENFEGEKSEPLVELT